MRRLVLALLTLAACFVLGGCATDTRVERVGPNSFVVCDDQMDEGDGNCRGTNPEKGLMDSCPTIGRSIASFREIENNAILVVCGPAFGGR